MNEVYSFEVASEVKAARAAINNFAQQTQKQLDSINMKASISAIADGFQIVKSVIGPVVDTIKETFHDAIEEALGAERAQFRLANALRLTGDAAGGAQGKFEALAKNLQKSTTFTDDSTLSAIGLAKQFQLTNAEATRAIKVAQDLAAATDGDLNGAMLKVAQTFNGFVSKDLAKMIPGLKNLTLEALLNGDALERIGARVKGTAAALGDTFGGVLISTKNAASELLETLGKLFTENAAIKSGLKVIRDGLIELNNQFEANGTNLRQLVTDGFVAFVKAVPIMVRAVSALDSGFDTMVRIGEEALLFFTRLPSALLQAVTGSSEALDQFKTDLANIRGTGSDSRSKFFDDLAKQAEKIAVGVEKAAKQTKNLADEVDKVGASTTGFADRFREKFGPEQLAEFTRKIADLRANLDNEVQGKLNEIANAPLSGIIKLAISGQEELDRAKTKIDKTISEIANNKEIPEAFKQQALALGEKAKEGLTEAFSGKSLGISIATGIVGAIKKGADGAADAVSGVAGGVATAFFGPIIGKFVGEIVGFLAQGPEKVKEQVKAFSAAIPDIIGAIAESIPVLIQQIVEDTPKIIDKLISMIPRLIDASIKSLPGIIKAIIAAVPSIVIAIVKDVPKIIQAIVRGIPEIIKGFVNGLIEGAKDFINALIEGIKDVGGNILGGVTGGGDSQSIFAGVPILQGVGDLFGFAGGGRIPNETKFKNDGAIARVGADEQIFNADLTRRLEKYLDANENRKTAGPIEINLTIGLQQFARIMFDARKAGYQV